MLPDDHPDRIHVAFDDHRLVANAGLILPATLALHLGLPQLIDRHLDLVSGPDSVLQTPQKGGQGQHGEIPAAYPAVAAGSGTPQLCRGGGGGPGRTGRPAHGAARRAHYGCPGGATQSGISPQRPRAFPNCSCPVIRRQRPGRTLDSDSRTAGLKGNGRERRRYDH